MKGDRGSTIDGVGGVIRVKTRSGREHNFGIPRDGMIHTIEHWLLDLKAQAAGRPVTGEGVGHA